MGQTWDLWSFLGAFQGQWSIWKIVLIGLIKAWKKEKKKKPTLKPLAF